MTLAETVSLAFPMTEELQDLIGAFFSQDSQDEDEPEEDEPPEEEEEEEPEVPEQA